MGNSVGAAHDPSARDHAGISPRFTQGGIRVAAKEGDSQWE
jgi:hypothetical protein